MRILVVSDSHRNESALRNAITQQPRAELVIHLGDGARQAQAMADDFPKRKIEIVCGNCDWGLSSVLPSFGLKSVGGYLIYYTHGHIHSVKSGLYNIISAARERKADVLLFGHTHIPICIYDDGLYILNPGSLTGRSPTYGIIDITDAGIAPFIAELRS
ncbi:MAG: YfcE family phosphodiesterase [Oscillospiraceae bacterium]|nr:YfcE family phosphodiesterase [Oscillospiraceae bacterium]